MIVVERILCPVDTSAFSERALRYAAALASWYEAELTALSVRPRFLPPTTVLPPTEGLDVDQAADQVLRAFVSGAIGRDAAQVVTTEGPVVQEILRIGAELPADLRRTFSWTSRRSALKGRDAAP